MKVYNKSQKTLVIADSATHYATLKPGEWSQDIQDIDKIAAIKYLIEQGMLVAQDRYSSKLAIKASKKPTQQSVSLIGEQEIVPNNQNVVAFDVPDSPDLVETPVPIIVNKDRTVPIKIEEMDGELLIKKGGKAKPTKIIKVSAQEIETALGGTVKIIKDNGTVSDEEGYVIINESGLPGQAKAVPISQIGAEGLDALRTATAEMMAQVQQDKKLIQIVNNYREWNKDKKLEMIDRFKKNPDVLQAMMNLEGSPAIKSKINSLLQEIVPTPHQTALTKLMKKYSKPKVKKIGRGGKKGKIKKMPGLGIVKQIVKVGANAKQG